MNKLSELEYKRPDLKKLNKQLKQAIAKAKHAPDYEAFKAAYREVENIFVIVFNANVLTTIRNNMNVADEYYEKEKAWLNEHSTAVNLTMVSFYKTLVKSPFRKQFDEEFGDFLTRKIENSLKLTNIFSLLDEIKENKLASSYSKDAAMCKCTFRKEECNFYGLLKHMESTDREERKEAFKAWSSLYESVSAKLDATYDRLVKLRVKKAKHLGFDNYIDYIYLNRERYDYTAKDISLFRDNVRDIIVPFCKELYLKQKERLHVDTLYFYDEKLVFPQGNALPIGNRDELVAKAKKMYEEMSKETGEYFNFMVEHELFDLETRPNKHMGGYCTFLPSQMAPFIFSNFNGTSADVDVLTHEAGHAFEAYVASRTQKTLLTVSSTSEINEIHSMAMEHFAYPWMENFFGENTDKYLFSHLSDTITTIPYLVSVDEFQHRVFENPKMDARQRRKVWHEIEEKYLPWRNYDDSDFLKEGGFWMQKQHIFLYPFYYVDYALASICALQLFIKSRKNREEAWNDYLGLCKLGGSYGYFDLLKKANLNNPFEKSTMEEVIGEVKKVLKEFEGNLK